MNDEDELVVLEGVEKISRQLEIPKLFEIITEVSDRRLLRQQRNEELNRGRDQLETWFENNVLKNKLVVESEKVDQIKWDRDNSIFADILLRSDHHDASESDLTEASPGPSESSTPPVRNATGVLMGIPVGPIKSRSPSRQRQPRTSILYPAHRAMLMRSEYFQTMFSSSFREAQETPHLHIVTVDCSPEVLELVLTFLYTERAEFGLDIAVDVLFAADQLIIEKLKQRAAIIISSLGSGSTSSVEAENPRGGTDAEEVVDIYEIMRAGWDLQVQRLEEFGARYIAYRLERYIDEPEFAQLVTESAKRVQARQETDTVELIDDIRYYLSERFRLRFEESGLDELMNASKEENGDPSSDEFKDADDPAAIPDVQEQYPANAIRTLDGEIAGDEFAQDAINYQILLGKIDTLLENLNLDA